MKSVTSFLLGTAAVIATSGMAYAADMGEVLAPAAAFEPAPPAPDCKGKKGYFIVPNTNTCLKILGLIRAQTLVHEGNVNTDSWDGSLSGVANSVTNNDTWSMGTAARFGADTTTETDYGTLRGNILLQADGDTDGTLGAGIRYAFITLAGVTVGHADSFFAPDGALGGYGSAAGDYSARRSLIGYTAKFNDQVSASISLEDHDSVDGGDGGPDPAKNADNLLVPTGTTVYNDGTQLPDLVGNVVGKFDWGLAFVSGAVGQYRTRQVGTNIPFDYTGFAVGAGGNIKLDGIAKGDAVQAKVGYADGATGYIGSSGDSAIIDTVGPDIDALTTAGFTVQGSFLHNWSPTWSSVAYGGYVNADRVAVPTDPTVYALLDNKLTSGWNVGANLQWSPIENYTVGGEVFYANVNKENTVTGDYSTDAIGSIFRVQREF